MSIWSWFKHAVSDIGDDISKGFNDVERGVTSVASTVSHDVVAAAHAAESTVTKAFSGVISAAKNDLTAVEKSASDTFKVVEHKLEPIGHKIAEVATNLALQTGKNLGITPDHVDVQKVVTNVVLSGGPQDAIGAAFGKAILKEAFGFEVPNYPFGLPLPTGFFLKAADTAANQNSSTASAEINKIATVSDTEGNIIFHDIVNKLSSGVSASKVVVDVFTRPEYERAFATNDAYVDSLYQHILGRDSDAAGKTFWTSLLNGADGHVHAHSEVVQAFLASAENKTIVGSIPENVYAA